jgi:hypothetical protein
MEHVAKVYGRIKTGTTNKKNVKTMYYEPSWTALANITTSILNHVKPLSRTEASETDNRAAGAPSKTVSKDSKPTIQSRRAIEVGKRAVERDGHGRAVERGRARTTRRRRSGKTSRRRSGRQRSGVEKRERRGPRAFHGHEAAKSSHTRTRLRLRRHKRAYPS